MRNFEELVYERFCIIFRMVVLEQLICITFVRSSFDNFKDNSGDNYFISSLIISFFFLNNYFILKNYLNMSILTLFFSPFSHWKAFKITSFSNFLF
jgi:hypothetical protein